MSSTRHPVIRAAHPNGGSVGTCVTLFSVRVDRAPLPLDHIMAVEREMVEVAASGSCRSSIMRGVPLSLAFHSAPQRHSTISLLGKLTTLSSMSKFEWNAASCGSKTWKQSRIDTARHVAVFAFWLVKISIVLEINPSRPTARPTQHLAPSLSHSTANIPSWTSSHESPKSRSTSE